MSFRPRILGRVLATTGVAVALVLGSAPGPAAADVAGPVVLLGTAGLRWSDVDSRTPALAEVRDTGAVGWLAVRSIRPVTCPVDGWLAVSSGRRAADLTTERTEPRCREPALDPAVTGGGATVPRWSDYTAAARDASFDAQPGLLGATLAAAGTPAAAVGPGAAIALADPQGRVSQAWAGSALTTDVTAALATDPHLLVVDLGAIRDPARQGAGEPTLTGAHARPREQQVADLDARLGLVLAELPPSATVIIASIGDSGTPSQLQLLAARGPAPDGQAFATALLASPSTRQDGLAQTTDLLPTLLAALSVPVPVEAVGTALAPVRTDLGTAARLRKLADLDDPTAVVGPIGPWVTNSLVAVHLLLYAAATLILRRQSGSPRRALGRLRTAAVVLASFPVATFLANLVPWWRAEPAGAALAAAVAGFMAVVSALALLGPWRKAVLGPATVIAGVTATVLTLDAVTGSRLMISGLLGVQPIVAGRFYGFNNTAFALFATSVLVIAVAVAERLIRGGHRRAAAAAVAGLGITATVIDGTPGLGSDFGGPPAIIPAFAVLTLLVLGIRVTWRRALLIAGVTIAVVVALSVLDWLRGPEDRTHLGRFVQSTIDGGAWSVVGRKGSQNLRILTGSFLSAMLLFTTAFVYFVLARPTRWGVVPLRAAYDRSPLLRSGLIAVLVLLVIAALLNDSGTAVPAYAMMMTIPLLVAACVRALEQPLGQRGLDSPEHQPKSMDLDRCPDPRRIPR